MNLKKYDFIDFGCSAGSSLKIYGKMFGVHKKRGLGLDINKKKVKLTLEKGFKAKVCDVTKIKLIKKVRFSIMSHFLEHIPSINDVKKIVEKACFISEEFLLIRQPYFDADPYLFSKGFKFYWSNWVVTPIT